MATDIPGLLRRVANRLERSKLKDRDFARMTIGGLWDEMGPLQLEFLQSRGLQPSDYMLDVGCGALRGGVHFVRYLEPGHYFGIDRQQWLLDAGMRELADAGIADRNPTLLRDNKFEFGRFNQTFDVALAQSVFTHINLNAVHRCLVKMSEVLRPGGVFYATILENKQDPNFLGPIEFPQPDSAATVTWSDTDPYCYPVKWMENFIEGLPLKLEHIGDWGSLRGQSMLAFHKI